MINIKKEVLKMHRNCISLNISGDVEAVPGGTRFGGMPDVPDNFEWPYFETDTFDDKEVKPRPLSFIAQFNCKEISSLDKEQLLPETGVLSFFYELDSQRWGYDPKDKGCARVYWFDDTDKLKPFDFPKDMKEDFRLPIIGIDARSEESYPSYEDFGLNKDTETSKWIERWDEYDDAVKSLNIDDKEISHKLLGWADPIQGNMTQECELVKRGYYLGDGLDDVTPQDRQEAVDHSVRDWLLLFQLDSLDYKDFELMFGDCGRIYFYIHRDDLEKRRFDKAWVILQCC